MRFAYTIAAALLAAVVSAQENAISVPEGSSTLEVTAGQPLTIDWTNPSDGTVTIKLQQDPITPEGGITLASGIPASALTATLTIPDAADVNSFLYTIEIIDDTDPTNINFSPNFGIVGATGTALGTASTASVTNTASTASRTSTGTSSDTTDSSTTTDSSSSSSTDESTTTSGSSSSSRTSSSTSSSTSASETTTAPSSNDNAAAGLKVQGGLFALAVGVFVAVM